MSAGHASDGSLAISYSEFTETVLPLYHESAVIIKIGTTTYKVSRELLSKKSPYFDAMFKKGFKEGEEQAADLKEVEGVVSTRAFQLLLQWVYFGRIMFDKEPPVDKITAILEFACLVDMTGIDGVQPHILHHVGQVIITPEDSSWTIDTNTKYVTCEHILAAIKLPKGHLLRQLLVRSSVVGYIRQNQFKFDKQILESPEYAADLLVEVKATFKSAAGRGKQAVFHDPLTGRDVDFSPSQGGNIRSTSLGWL